MASWQFTAILLVFGFYFSLGREQRLSAGIDADNLEQDFRRKDTSREQLIRIENQLRPYEHRDSTIDRRLISQREANENRFRQFDNSRDRMITAERRLAYDGERNRDMDGIMKSIYREEVYRIDPSIRRITNQRQNLRLLNERNLQMSRQLPEYRDNYMTRREYIMEAKDDRRIRYGEHIRERLTDSEVNRDSYRKPMSQRFREIKMLERERNVYPNRQNEEQRMQKKDLTDYNNIPKVSILLQQPYLTFIQCSVLAFMLMKALKSKEKLNSGEEQMHAAVRTLVK